MSERLDDLLRGAQEIADFIGIPRPQVYRLIERRIIPAGHIGGNPKAVLLASKRRIAAALDKIAAGEAP